MVFRGEAADEAAPCRVVGERLDRLPEAATPVFEEFEFGVMEGVDVELDVAVEDWLDRGADLVRGEREASLVCPRQRLGDERHEFGWEARQAHGSCGRGSRVRD